MKWEEVKLSECCTSIADGDHQAPPKVDDGIPFVTISNINSTNQLDFTNTMFVPQSYYDKLDDRRKAKNEDILYSVVGSFGIPVFIKNERAFVFQRHIAILRANKSKIDPHFLYYAMTSYNFLMQADTVAIGAAQRTITLSSLNRMTVPYPPLATQQRIADVLSAYDDLIENNEKQIKLLEEAAQRLYKEWFVKLHFPSYEHTKIVDGVPEGWRKEKLAGVAIIQTGKKDANFATQDGIYPFFTCSQEALKASSYSFDLEAVILSGNGEFCSRIYRGKFEAYQRTYVISPKDKENLYMLYNAISKSMSQLFQGASGSTIKFLTIGMINNLVILIPNKKILNTYNCICELTQDYLELLNKQNKILIEARNRLLPKLMSGKIEV